MFERKWKLLAEVSKPFDLDTLPTKPRIRSKLNLTEVETRLLALFVY